MPIQLSQLIGHPNIKRTLVHLLDSQRIPHAMLFEGPAGLGKTTYARAFAATLLCKNINADRSACGTCTSCQKLDANSHVDFLEIKPENGKIKIDAIRTLEHWLRLRPTEHTNKVVIISQSETMNVQSQNALLKTLEEPLPNRQLILVCNRLRALKPTIISRCQRHRFQPLNYQDSLQIIRQTHEENAANILCSLAQGAPGTVLEYNVEAISALITQVATYDTQITSNRPGATEHALQMAQDFGKDKNKLQILLNLWVLWLRDQLCIKMQLPQEELAYADRLQELLNLAHQRSLLTILQRSKAVIEAQRQILSPFNLNGTMLVEQLGLSLTGLINPKRMGNI